MRELKEPKFFSKEHGWYVSTEHYYPDPDWDYTTCQYLHNDGKIYNSTQNDNKEYTGYFETQDIANFHRTEYLKGVE